MKTLLLAAALTGLTIATLSTDARAQTSGTATHSNAIKLGLFSPSKGPVRQVAGNQLFSVEADQVLQSIPERNETNVLSVGFTERNSLRIFSFSLSQLKHDNKRTSAYNYYYGWGISLNAVRLTAGETSGRTKIMPGIPVTFGVNISNNTFAEAKYHFNPNYEGYHLNGFTVALGTRF